MAPFNFRKMSQKPQHLDTTTGYNTKRKQICTLDDLEIINTVSSDKHVVYMQTFNTCEYLYVLK